jgi:hypothetical protein
MCPQRLRVGGAVGDVRSAIHQGRFSDYIAVNVPEIVVPVQIKQFQVCVAPEFFAGLT